MTQLPYSGGRDPDPTRPDSVSDDFARVTLLIPVPARSLHACMTICIYSSIRPSLISTYDRVKLIKKGNYNKESYHIISYYTRACMGACLSSSSGTEMISDLIDHSATAKVITVDGHLLEYSAAVKAYEVLGLSHPLCFLCSSDDLDRDAPIPPLGSQDSLERGQLYFVLPVESLRGPLRGRDMAALAVRASSALAAAPDQTRLAHDLPISEADGGVIEDDVFEGGSDRFHGTSARHLEKEKVIRRKEKVTGREKFMGWPHYRARLGTIRELAE